ncbi:glycosyltransferase family 39 protein [Kitasatospora sp. A2-31]|uniref:glycosyltransferase family 39 protein n=1 Tax=Kitasatospora sp. A2-31 TaxID=2916414 RepID=UPI001EEF111F|nr:glycosyltransferase family 39 protein [Kitasatospora sp. A2-31]MCG6498991.1 glycosyltransferase family 39 protein [Kitasatospora sp. A2-31]
MRPAAAPHPAIRLLGQVWVWPALAMLCVGGYRLGTPELWRDEVATWSAASRSLGDLLRLLQHIDASNGAYYLVMHFWTALFGESMIALRLPSVLAMAGAAAFVALTAERLFGGRVAAISGGLLFTLVPMVSRYAQEARSYALVTCAVAAATWFLLRALERPGLRRWAPYCAAMAVAGAGHVISFSTVAGQLAVVLLHLWRTRDAVQRRLLWQYPLAVAVAALPAVPVLVLGSRQSGRQLGWITTPGLGSLWRVGASLFGSADVFHVFLLLALLALVLPGRRPPALQLAMLATLPVLVVWLASRGGTSYFLDRYLLFTVPAWASLAGGGVRAVYTTVAAAARRSRTPRQLRAAGLLLAVGLLAVPAAAALPKQSSVRQADSHSEEPYRSAADLIAAGYRPGDGLAAPLGDQSWAMLGPGVSYYLPAGVRPYPVFVERSAEQAEDLFPTECPEPERCVGQGQRIWLLVLGDTAEPLAALPDGQARALRSRYGAPDRVTPLGGVTLALLDRTTP